MLSDLLLTTPFFSLSEPDLSLDIPRETLA